MTDTLPEPKSRKEEFLAKAAGMSGVTLPEPASREEEYLNAIAKGGGGGGGSYSAGDGIDITNNTISVDTTTIQPKLTAGTNITISDENVISASGGGSAGVPKVLTSADYNWNGTSHSATAPYDCIAPWLLSPGLYKFDMTVYVTEAPAYAGLQNSVFNGRTALVMKEERGSGNNDNYVSIIMYDAEVDKNTVAVVNYSPDGVMQNTPTNGKVLKRSDINNTLTSTNQYQVLSAKQGKELKALIDGIAISGAGAPTTSTVGTVGRLYEDTTNGKLYICTAVSGSTYTWTEIGSGGGGGITCKELTAADYNYDKNNDGTNDTVALWLLDPGFYWWEFDFANGGGITFNKDTSSAIGNSRLITYSNHAMVNYSGNNNSNKIIKAFNRNIVIQDTTFGWAPFVPFLVNTSTGAVINFQTDAIPVGRGDLTS